MMPIRFDIKQVFLIDSLGAILSSFFLRFILVQFQPYFGMPIYVLYLLPVIAFCFFIFSIGCYFIQPPKLRYYLKLIAYANLTYCFVTGLLVTYHIDSLTTLGIAYFIFEIIVIILLVRFELFYSLRK